MEELEEKIKEYLKLKNEIERLTAEKAEVEIAIKNLIETNTDNGKYTTEDGIKASLTDRITYKYTDEVAIINYLTRNGLKNIYVTEKLDATKLNNELKTEGVLYENIKSFVDKNVTPILKVSN